MRRIVLLSTTGLAILLATALSQAPMPITGDVKVEIEDRNPWTSLQLNNDPADFRFAIVSDRTGGHRARIFSQAVEQINLLQPEFVVCVGDLIEGYTDKADRLAGEWKEFQSFVSRLQMPFFYVPGNHDLANATQDKMWQQKFGRKFYHVNYRGVLFLMLNSSDPAGKTGIGEEQLAGIKIALEKNPAPRWTLVFLHHPLWNEPGADKNGWQEVEKLLVGRPYTVFVGHVHRYQKFVRQGMNYYQLATTGGGSKVRGPAYGEFDHLVWVTMKKDGPVLANLMLDGIYREDLTRPVTEEPGRAEPDRRTPLPVTGHVLVDGTPAAGATVTFLETNVPTGKRAARADGLVEADGSFTLSTYSAFDGVPAGQYTVTVVQRVPRFEPSGKPGPNLLPQKYASAVTSGLTATVNDVKDGRNEFTFELKRESAEPKKKEEKKVEKP